MATLEEQLLNGEVSNLEQAIDLYRQSEKSSANPEDAILNDPELIKQLAGIWRENEPALRALVVAMNADLVRYMVQKATPVETVGIRHELQGAEKLLIRLAKYSAVYERQEAEEKARKETEEEEPPVSPPVEGEGAL